MNRIFGTLRNPSVLLGVICAFLAERFFEGSKARLWLIGSSFVLVLLAIAFTWVSTKRAKAEALHGEAQSFFYSLAWLFMIFLGLGFYFLYAKFLPATGSPETFGQKALLALWLLSFIIGAFAGVGTELALHSSGLGPYGEPKRVVRSAASWASVGMVLSALICFNFAGSKKDKSYDLSYLKVTRPGEATVKMVATLSEDIQVGAFFPETNEVRPFVEEYMKALQSKEGHLKVTFYDKDMAPTKAEELRVADNGQIVLEMGGKRERIDIGKTLSAARNSLKKFDAEFQKVFLSLTSLKKTVYFSRGHGEGSWIGTSTADNPLKSLRGLESILRDQNYAVRFWGVAEGSTNEVPTDASALAVIGPTQPLLKEEAAAIHAYLQRGGKLLVYLDQPKASDSAAPKLAGSAVSDNDALVKVLAESGIQYHSDVLANDKNYVVATRSPSDKWFVVTNSFTSHDSVTSLARHDERIAIIALQAGYLTVTPSLGNWKALETVRTLADTFIDLNKNYTFDSDKEKRGSYAMGAIATMAIASPAPAAVPTPGTDGKSPPKPVEEKAPQEARVVAFSGASAISDPLLQSPGNVLYAVDAFKWLVGESKTSGTISSEEDVKIQHTKDKEAAWFYSTVMGVPLLVLGAGFFATRRGSSRRKVIEHAS